jgi:hypothetical protein
MASARRPPPTHSLAAAASVRERPGLSWDEAPYAAAARLGRYGGKKSSSASMAGGASSAGWMWAPRLDLNDPWAERVRAAAGWSASCAGDVQGGGSSPSCIPSAPIPSRPSIDPSHRPILGLPTNGAPAGRPAGLRRAIRWAAGGGPGGVACTHLRVTCVRALGSRSLEAAVRLGRTAAQGGGARELQFEAGPREVARLRGRLWAALEGAAAAGLPVRPAKAPAARWARRRPGSEVGLIYWPGSGTVPPDNSHVTTQLAGVHAACI